MSEEGLDSEAADETELVNSLAELDSHLVQVQTGLRSRSVFLPAPGEGALFWVAKFLLVLKDPAGIDWISSLFDGRISGSHLLYPA